MRFILLLFMVFLVGCKEQIVHNLSEIDANKLVTRLHDANIDGEKEKQADGKWSISVPSDESIKALKLLNDSRILRSENSRPIEKASVISSREDQRFHYERSLSQEIESTLASVPGVLEARVHLNIPPVDPLFGKPVGQGGSASVLLVTDSTLTTTKEEVAGLVSGASGIKADSISVLFSRSVDEVKVQSEVTEKSTTIANEEVHGEIATLPKRSGMDSIWLQIALSALILVAAGGWWFLKKGDRKATAVVAKALAELGDEGK